MPQASFQSRATSIEPGALLAIYSDGLSEAENPQDEEFGLERLTALVSRLRDEEPRQAAQAMLQELVAFESTAPRKDDCTLVLVKRLPSSLSS